MSSELNVDLQTFSHHDEHTDHTHERHFPDIKSDVVTEGLGGDGLIENGPKIPEKKLRYPFQIIFIIMNEFCERFSYYGMRTILILYLTNWFKLSDDSSAMIYHTFVLACYFFPVVGAIVADSYWGKFKTIFWFCVVYAIGNLTLSGSSILNPVSQKPLGLTLAMIGLLCISFGTGGIKPCVSSFGGDQFVKPQQENYLAYFFSVFYFSINAGSLISTFFIPMVREDISCFGYDTCYPLAFGIPAFLMITSFVIFLIGKPLYTITKPEGNIMVLVCKCMWYASRQRSALKKTVKKDHWLDYADDKFDKRLINDTKILLHVLYLYITTPIFWSLYEQQGSLWILQAQQMDGTTGSYVITPDQFQVFNPICILLFIPIFDYVVYPIFAKCNLLKNPLQRLFIGGLVAAAAFVCSGALQMIINNSLPVTVPADNTAQLRLYNGYDCAVSVQVVGYDPINISPLQMQMLSVNTTAPTDFKYDVSVSCAQNYSGNIQSLKPKDLQSYYIYENVEQQERNTNLTDEIAQPEEDSLIRVLSNDFSKCKISKYEYDVKNRNLTNIKPGGHSVTCDGYDIKVDDFFIRQRGVYALIIDGSSRKGSLNIVTPPNKISMWWQTPQIIVITAAEILFSITGLDFSYTQAPQSMKSVISAAWLLTDAFGNVIIIFVEAFQIQNKILQYYLFAALMALTMIVFWFMARNYKFVTTEDLYPPELEEEQPKKMVEGFDNPEFKND